MQPKSNITPEQHQALIENVGNVVRRSGMNQGTSNLMPHARMLGIPTHLLHESKDEEHPDVEQWESHFNREGQNIQRPGISGIQWKPNPDKQGQLEPRSSRYTDLTHYRLGYILSDLMKNGKLGTNTPNQTDINNAIHNYVVSHPVKTSTNATTSDEDLRSPERARELYASVLPDTAHSAIKIINDRLNTKSPTGSFHHHRDYVAGLLKGAAEWQRNQESKSKEEFAKLRANLPEGSNKKRIKELQDNVDHHLLSNNLANPYMHALTSYLISSRYSTDPSREITPGPFGEKQLQGTETPDLEDLGSEESTDRSGKNLSVNDAIKRKIGKYIVDKINTTAEGKAYDLEDKDGKRTHSSEESRLSKYFPNLDSNILISLLRDPNGSIHHLIHSLSETDNPENLPARRSESTERLPYSNKTSRYNRLFDLFDRHIEASKFDPNKLLEHLYTGNIDLTPGQLNDIHDKLSTLTAGGGQVPITKVVQSLKNYDPQVISMVLNPNNQIIKLSGSKKVKGIDNLEQKISHRNFENHRNSLLDRRLIRGIGTSKIPSERFNPEADMNARNHITSWVHANNKILQPHYKIPNIIEEIPEQKPKEKVVKERKPREKEIKDPNQEAVDRLLYGGANSLFGIDKNGRQFYNSVPETNKIHLHNNQLALSIVARYISQTRGEDQAREFLNAIGTPIPKRTGEGTLSPAHARSHQSIENLYDQNKDQPVSEAELNHAFSTLKVKRGPRKSKKWWDEPNTQKSLQPFRKYLSETYGL